jgi:hypothetical protein
MPAAVSPLALSGKTPGFDVRLQGRSARAGLVDKVSTHNG